jgi:hypothetical protein
MAYTPTDWADGVTPVNAANLDKLEAAVVAAEEKALKAQPNGYASLDSGGKVPLIQLPPVGADLVYNGAYVPATSYEDGDIVVGADNIAYICVTPTSTPPEAWPGGPVAVPPSTIPYGTSLPPSPADGQEAILVDSLTNPTYTWRFRYNAQSASAYKWEFVGGAPLVSSYIGSQSVAAVGAWVPGAPQITVPRTGQYVGTLVAEAAPPAINAVIQVGLTADAANPLVTQFTDSQPLANYARTISASGLLLTLTLGQTLQHLYWSNVANTPWAKRTTSLLPVRVA